MIATDNKDNYSALMSKFSCITVLEGEKEMILSPRSRRMTYSLGDYVKNCNKTAAEAVKDKRTKDKRKHYPRCEKTGNLQSRFFRALHIIKENLISSCWQAEKQMIFKQVEYGRLILQRHKDNYDEK